jgi:hypothetical protein
MVKLSPLQLLDLENETLLSRKHLVRIYSGKVDEHVSERARERARRGALKLGLPLPPAVTKRAA